MKDISLSLDTLHKLNSIWKEPYIFERNLLKDVFSKSEIEDIFNKIIDIDDIIENHSIIFSENRFIKNRFTNEKVILLQLKAIYEYDVPHHTFSKENKKLNNIHSAVMEKHNARESLVQRIERELKELSGLHGARVFYFGYGNPEKFTVYLPIKMEDKIDIPFEVKYEFVEKFIENYMLTNKDDMSNLIYDYMEDFLSDTDNDDYKQHAFLQTFKEFIKGKSPDLIDDTLDKMVTILENIRNSK